MHLLKEGYPVKYPTAESILADFCKIRYSYYVKRREYWLAKYKADLKKETDRYKYVKAVNSGDLDMNQDDAELEKDMIELGLRKIEGKFDYLLSMQMRSMTVKKMEEIEKEIASLKQKVKYYTSKTPAQLWKIDLVKFREAYVKFLTTRVEEGNNEKRNNGKKAAKYAKKK
jgi:hypothetical protein